MGLSSVAPLTEVDINSMYLDKQKLRVAYSTLYRRKVKVEQGELNDYIKRLSKLIDDKVLRGESVELYNSHLLTIKENRKGYRHYNSDLTGVRYDEMNEIVLTGCTLYSKEFVTVYSLEDSLDFILANLFMGNQREIRENIQRNAEVYGTDYIGVSRAILGYNKHVMEKINLDVFLDVTYNLDRFLVSLVEISNFRGIRDFDGMEISLEGYNFTEEEKVVSVFSIMIIRYMEKMMSYLMVEKYLTLKFKHGSNLNAVSRGIGNIVIYGDVELGEENDIKLYTKLGSTTIRCLTDPKGEFYKRLGEEYCY